MPDLIPRPPAKIGRPRTTTARAWIVRASRRAEFKSHVSLGNGRVFILATATANRAKALEFNRAHLLSKLLHIPSPSATQAVEQQLELGT